MRFDDRLRTALAGPSTQRRDDPVRWPHFGDLVGRILRLRRREAGTAAPAGAIQEAEAEADEAPRLIRWECNESGDIEWVEGAPRGAMIGRSIVQRGVAGDVGRSIEHAFAARLPFHDERLEIAGAPAVSGAWKMSAVPVFDPASGRFAGYRGVAQRAADALPAAGAERNSNADSLRELAHEIKTPLNAIIGFAEVITGEYLGPAEDRYRDRASMIVAHARLLLTCIEDLDFAAKLRSDGGSSPAELSECVESAWPEIERHAQSCGAAVVYVRAAEPVGCALAPQLTQRLVERVGAAVVGYASPGEVLTFRVGADDECCSLAIDRPASLKGVDLSPDRNRRSGDTATLPLRLVVGLARAAGGELEATGDRLSLHLPKAELAPASCGTYLESGGACSSTVEPAAHNG